jgi:hypothetical protein
MRTLAVLEGLKLAEKYGIPIARTVEFGKGELPFPVAAKPDTAEHKSEKGLVFVGVNDKAELEKIAGKLAPSRTIVQEMAEGTEIILGAKKDPVFGYVVMVGIGGTLAEAYSDVAFGVAPLKEMDALEMIGALKGQKIIDGFRGKPIVDRGKLARMIVSLSKLASDEKIIEIDLNPVVATDDGRLLAVDARAVLE